VVAFAIADFLRVNRATSGHLENHSVVPIGIHWRHFRGNSRLARLQ